MQVMPNLRAFSRQASHDIPQLERTISALLTMAE